MPTTDSIQVQVKFSISEDGIDYSDCLYFTPEEHKALSDEDLETLKRERFEQHKLNLIEHKKPRKKEVRLVLQDLREKKDVLLAEVEAVNQKIDFYKNAKAELEVVED
jgi:hypothetical protein